MRAVDLRSTTPACSGIRPARSSSTSRSRTVEARLARVAALGACDEQQGPCQPSQAIRLSLDQLEELVADGGLVLRAGLQHLDRGDDRRQRRAQLVRRVRRELALRPLVALALGLVRDHQDRRICLPRPAELPRSSGRARRSDVVFSCTGNLRREQVGRDAGERLQLGRPRRGACPARRTRGLGRSRTRPAGRGRRGSPRRSACRAGARAGAALPRPCGRAPRAGAACRRSTGTGCRPRRGIASTRCSEKSPAPIARARAAIRARRRLIRMAISRPAAAATANATIADRGPSLRTMPDLRGELGPSG